MVIPWLPQVYTSLFPFRSIQSLSSLLLLFFFLYALELTEDRINQILDLNFATNRHPQHPLTIKWDASTRENYLFPFVCHHTARRNISNLLRT